ncbi:MAG: hypothetical protein DMG08_16380 [Acidobacteria bacterium]|nr:MAG: hypothetical protein DMG08_16380 [Acidobacteriota bacterium]
MFSIARNVVVTEPQSLPLLFQGEVWKNFKSGLSALTFNRVLDRLEFRRPWQIRQSGDNTRKIASYSRLFRNERLVFAFADLTKRSMTDWPFSNANFFDLRNGARTMFEDFAAVAKARTISLWEDGTPEQIRIATVTPNFFRLLGAEMALGRDFLDADRQAQPKPAARRLCNLSSGCQRSRS